MSEKSRKMSAVESESAALLNVVTATDFILGFFRIFGRVIFSWPGLKLPSVRKRSAGFSHLKFFP